LETLEQQELWAPLVRMVHLAYKVFLEYLEEKVYRAIQDYLASKVKLVMQQLLGFLDKKEMLVCQVLMVFLVNLGQQDLVD